MKRHIRLIISLCLLIFLCSQSVVGQSISTVDIVKIKAQYEKEAMYFYEQNWLAFRKEALTQKVISGYELIRSVTDSTNHFTITLITKYENAALYKASEEKFRPIMRKISPGGPKMLNAITRKEFLEYVTSVTGEILYQNKE